MKQNEILKKPWLTICLIIFISYIFIPVVGYCLFNWFLLDSISSGAVFVNIILTTIFGIKILKKLDELESLIKKD